MPVYIWYPKGNNSWTLTEINAELISIGLNCIKTHGTCITMLNPDRGNPVHSTSSTLTSKTHGQSPIDGALYVRSLYNPSIQILSCIFLIQTPGQTNP